MTDAIFCQAKPEKERAVTSLSLPIKCIIAISRDEYQRSEIIRPHHREHDQAECGTEAWLLRRMPIYLSIGMREIADVIFCIYFIVGEAIGEIHLSPR